MSWSGHRMCRTASRNSGSEVLRLVAIHGASQFDTEWLAGDDRTWASQPPR
jgi:hypothetical protein